MRYVALLWITIGIILFSGCASKGVQVTLLPEENGKVGTISIADTQGKAHTINSAYEALDISLKGEINTVLENNESVHKKYAETLNALPQKPESHLFYFGFDNTTLDAKQLAELKNIAQSIKEKNSVQVICIGHSDSSGDKEYNKILSLQRARKVAEKLVSHSVDKSLIILKYYGDANPLDTSNTKEGNAKNRRVEIILK